MTSRHVSRHFRVSTLITMARENIKTLLLVTSFGSESLFPFLFEFSKYWAKQGRQILYISTSRIQALPPSLGDTGRPDSNILKLMQFMYLPEWKDVLHQLATIHIRRFQVRAIVVANLTDYLNENSQSNKEKEYMVSHICATLLFASALSFKATGEPIALVCGYTSDNSTIEQNIVKNFFHNIWEVKRVGTDNKETELVISNLSPSSDGDVVSFSYTDPNEELLNKDRSNVKLHLTEIIRQIIDEYNK